MDKKDYLPILQALADGCNPITGEVLPNTSPYNEQNVIRALYSAMSDLNVRAKSSPRSIAERKEKNKLNNQPENYGLPWMPEDRKLVEELFLSDISFIDIAKKLGRTYGSIVSELEKQGLITQEERIAVNDTMQTHPNRMVTKSLVKNLN